MRRTSVQPDGGVMAAPELLKPTAAISMSPDTVPAGVEIVRLTLAGRSASRCALPASALPAAVAVLVPVAAASGCSTRLPSIERPVALLEPLGRSKDSVIAEGGVQVLDEANACEVTTIVLATVVVRFGVACVRLAGVVCPFSTSIGVAVSTPENACTPPTV